MKTEYETTSARVSAGHGAPAPTPPAGGGWTLHQTSPGHDGEGKPVLIWTWKRDVLEQGDDEELVQA